MSSADPQATDQNGGTVARSGAHEAPPRPETPSLLSAFSHHASVRPDQPATTFLLDDRGTQASLSYKELHDASLRIAANLATTTQPGDRVLLLFEPGLDFGKAFMACLFARRIAVPAYPPDPQRLDRSMARLNAILSDSAPALILTSNFILQTKQFLEESTGTKFPGKWAAIDELETGDLEPTRNAPEEPEEIALLQYTSGSTGVPRGVMVSHRNLYKNVAWLESHFLTSPDTPGVSWLPQYHDMGLIGALLLPFYSGFTVTLMSPIAFLQRPLRWLKALSDTHSYITACPNFALDLCVRKVSDSDMDSLDLSNLAVLANGGEPIRAESLRRFSERFQRCGFRHEAHYPTFGLAENTLNVTLAARGEAPRVLRMKRQAYENGIVQVCDSALTNGAEAVACGTAARGTDVQVVNPQTLVALEEDTIGEICVSGPSVAEGYWNQPETNKRVFPALDGDTAKRWLRTGDLGFLHEGELYVTGRIKDVIIRHGKNIYPQDIEAVASGAHTALRKGCAIAFGLHEHDEEQIVLVHEISAADEAVLAEAASAIREHVLSAVGLPIGRVVLVKPGAVPKTSSGKLQRSACKASYLASDLPVLAEDRGALATPVPLAADVPLDSTAREILDMLSVVADRKDIMPATSLASLGIDSLGMAEIQTECEDRYNTNITAQELYALHSVGDLISIVNAQSPIDRQEGRSHQG